MIHSAEVYIIHQEQKLSHLISIHKKFLVVSNQWKTFTNQAGISDLGKTEKMFQCKKHYKAKRARYEQDDPRIWLLLFSF